MIAQKIPKKPERDAEGRWQGNNKEELFIIMTRDEAVSLIASLVKFLNENPRQCGGSGCPSFPDGLWGEKGINFAVMREPLFWEMMNDLRKEAEEKKENS